MKKEYTIVSALSPEKLVEVVTEKIKEGWDIIGGAFGTTRGFGGVWIHQTMTKDTKEAVKQEGAGNIILDQEFTIKQ